MSRVYRRGASWYIDFRDGKGSKKRLRVGRSRQEAEEVLAVMGHKATLRRFEGIPQRDNDVDLSTLREDFYELHLPRLRSSTQRRTRLALDTIFNGISESRKVSELTGDVVEAYLQRRKREVSARTCNIELANLKRLLNWGADTNRIAGNPIARVRMLPLDHQYAKRALTRPEVDKLLEASPQPYRDIWTAFVLTGFRHNELVCLTWGDVALDGGELTVRAEVSKTHAQDRIPIHPDLRTILEGYRRTRAPEMLLPDKPVFVNQAGAAWRNNLLRRFKACADRAGIGGPGVNLHCLRYTFISQLIRQGVNIKTVQTLARHKDVKMTLGIYAQMTRVDLVDGIGALDFGEKRTHRGHKAEAQIA